MQDQLSEILYYGLDDKVGEALSTTLRIAGNHSVRIDGDEMLSSTLGPGKGRFEEGTVKSFTNINNGYGNKTKSVEFLGDGGPPDGASFYTRAGIVLCPRQNRTKVVEQAVDADVKNTGFHA